MNFGELPLTALGTNGSVSMNRDKTSQINDLNLKDWKGYDDILTDSLWLIGERDKSGAHNSLYHGKPIPRISNHIIGGFAKQADLVLCV